ncbi:MAG TPA: hypothetical protein VFE05_23340 [Longimicrobiaceae bacterium]|jgi:hypothetical protein|nr:hypothetical protein [Longimicrobiaceae bacterium]
MKSKLDVGSIDVESFGTVDVPGSEGTPEFNILPTGHISCQYKCIYSLSTCDGEVGCG